MMRTITPQPRALALAVAFVLALELLLPGCSDDKGATTAGQGTATPEPSAERQLEVQFGEGKLLGSLLLPARAPGERVPAAVIISGSGAVDRDGNARGFPGQINANLNFARALAEMGVASLRYDKPGVGASTTNSPSADRNDIEQDVQAAAAVLAYLKTQAEVDPERVFILGHSEGGLIALVIANRHAGADGPRALVLAAPPGGRYLDILRRQLRDQYTQAQAQGLYTVDQTNQALAEVDEIVDAIRQTGTAPASIATLSLRGLFTRANVSFLASADRYDPQALAASVPPAMPVLVLRGLKDQQVAHEDFEALMDGLRQAGNAASAGYELDKVNHVFKEVPGTPNPAADYANPALSFSHEATERLREFVRTRVK